MLTHGANEAMDIVIRYFVPPGGKVLVDDPGYYPLFGKLKLASAQVFGVPRLSDGPDLEALEQLLISQRPRIFFTQSLAHNPTGSDLSAAKAFRVLQLAQKYNLLIADYLALVGDPQDGYPGVPGIGAVGAARLLNRHGPIEAFPPAVLGQQLDRALLFKRLATLRRDAALFDDVEQLRWRGPTERFADWTRRMNAPRLLERCLAASTR